MFEQGISREARTHLALLKEALLPMKVYLAGGTACALHLGHRLSIDLDFFSAQSFDTKKVLDALAGGGRFTVTQEAQNTLGGYWDGVRVSFFTYAYPLLDKLETFDAVDVAGLRDLGCMKLSAIAARGTKRDFVDLFFILETVDFETLVESFKKKYAGVNYSLGHILKSITYFDDAEEDAMPHMLKAATWNDVKRFLEQQSTEWAKRHL